MYTCILGRFDLEEGLNAPLLSAQDEGSRATRSTTVTPYKTLDSTTTNNKGGGGGGGGSGVSIEFKGVYFHYPAQEPNQGLRDVSFRVNAGTTTAIVGHTGSG